MNYAILAGIYTAGATVASGVRCTNDSLNYGVGGACVGAFIGLRAKSLHRVVVNAVVLGAVGTVSKSKLTMKDMHILFRRLATDFMRRDSHYQACAYSTNLLNNPSMDQRKKFYERYSYLPQEDSKA